MTNTTTLPEGCFKAQLQHRFSVSNLRPIVPWSLPRTFNDDERLEEAAARILSFSQKAGRWVGVSAKMLATMLVEDLEREAEVAEIRRRNQAAQDEYRREMKRYDALRFGTCGLWVLFRDPPFLEQEKNPEDALPKSGIFSHGAKFVADAVRELEKKGFLLKEKVGKEDVFFPHPRLTEKVIQLQLHA